MIRKKEYVISSTYLKNNDSSANGLELTIVVKKRTGVKKLVDILFNSLEDDLVLARMKGNTITIIIGYGFNSIFLLDNINQLIYELEGNIKERYLRKVENRFISDETAINILEGALKEFDKNSDEYTLALKGYNRLKKKIQAKNNDIA